MGVKPNVFRLFWCHNHKIGALRRIYEGKTGFSLLFQSEKFLKDYSICRKYCNLRM